MHSRQGPQRNLLNLLCNFGKVKKSKKNEKNKIKKQKKQCGRNPGGRVSTVHKHGRRKDSSMLAKAKAVQ